MKRTDLITQKILKKEQLQQRVAQWRMQGKKIAFTNGVFDILHKGHILTVLLKGSKEITGQLIMKKQEHLFWLL